MKTEQVKKYTIQQFKEQFPNDDACLDYLFKQNYGELTGCPNCSVESKFNRVKNRRAYQCPICSYQIYPTANTVFHQTTTPLTYWFYAIYLFTTTRNGVAAKELERQLSICYKTALRMAHQIKTLMMDNSNEKLFGEVMIDETYFGMLGKNMHKYKKIEKDIKTGSANKIGVMGFIQKEDGKMLTKVLKIETSPSKTLKKIVEDYVDPSATVVTDAHPSYKNLRKSFKKHVRVDHGKREFVLDGYSTNRVENYWSTLKRMIKGTHIHVSKKHLSKYVAENTFRYVNRDKPEQMLFKILENAKCA